MGSKECWETNPMELLVATQNKGKQQEFAELFSVLKSVDILFPSDFTGLQDLDPEEIGSSFKEIALKKAKEFAKHAGVTTVSDDSGLCIHMLDGKPGIHSKRFYPGSDQDRNTEILRLMRDSNDRSAYFISVLALYNPKEDTAQFFEGIVEGTIALEAKGKQGFGYDPIFIPKGYNETFALLGQEIKNSISHRKNAIIKLVKYLQEKDRKKIL